jgi:multicomponent K+:H+ antiporter subunit G
MTTVAALLVLAGALLAFLGSLGLLRMKTFFERVHPPTMGTTLGTALVLAGSMLYFTALERLVLHEILIGVRRCAASRTIPEPDSWNGSPIRPSGSAC